MFTLHADLTHPTRSLAEISRRVPPVRSRHWLSFQILIAALLIPWQAVHAGTYPLPPSDVDLIGEIFTVKTREEDTLLQIARLYGVGFNEIRDANPNVDMWVPGEGTEVIIPTQFILPSAPRVGVVINLPELRLYYYPPTPPGQPPVVTTFPISIGRMDWNTPLGNTKIVAKTENPSWYPPASIRKEHAEDGDELPAFIPPGPNNPLGNHAIRLGLPGYLIHGTNRPEGVGMRVTHGCIRMFPEDVEYLFKILPVGTQVNLINEPYKAGWLAGKLYFEAHPQLEEEAEQHVKFNYEPVIQAIGHATEYRPARIDRNSLKTLLDEHRGFPGVISRE